MRFTSKSIGMVLIVVRNPSCLRGLPQNVIPFSPCASLHVSCTSNWRFRFFLNAWRSPTLLGDRDQQHSNSDTRGRRGSCQVSSLVFSEYLCMNLFSLESSRWSVDSDCGSLSRRVPLRSNLQTVQSPCSCSNEINHRGGQHLR